MKEEEKERKGERQYLCMRTLDVGLELSDVAVRSLADPTDRETATVSDGSERRRGGSRRR